MLLVTGLEVVGAIGGDDHAVEKDIRHEVELNLWGGGASQPASCKGKCHTRTLKIEYIDYGTQLLILFVKVKSLDLVVKAKMIYKTHLQNKVFLSCCAKTVNLKIFSLKNAKGI